MMSPAARTCPTMSEEPSGVQVSPRTSTSGGRSMSLRNGAAPLGSIIQMYPLPAPGLPAAASRRPSGDQLTLPLLITVSLSTGPRVRGRPSPVMNRRYAPRLAAALSPGVSTYAMTSSTCDQAGEFAAASVASSFVSPLATVAIVSCDFAPGTAYTSFVLSGDQLTVSTTGVRTISRGVPPSAATTQMPRWPARDATNATCRPSGEHA